MISINDITEKISLPKLDLTKLELPKFELPKFELPKFELPKFELPKFDAPKIDVSRASDLARDAAYVGVGAVVVSVQTVTEQIAGHFRKVVGSTD